MFDLLKKSEIKNEVQIKPRLVTLKEAATLIEGLSEYRLRQMCISGELQHHKFGKKFMVLNQTLLEHFSTAK